MLLLSVKMHGFCEYEALLVRYTAPEVRCVSGLKGAGDQYILYAGKQFTHPKKNLSCQIPTQTLLHMMQHVAD